MITTKIKFNFTNKCTIVKDFFTIQDQFLVFSFLILEDVEVFLILGHLMQVQIHILLVL